MLMVNCEQVLPAAGAGSGLLGLSDGEVQARRACGQGNTAPPSTGRSYRQIIVENVLTFPNITLFVLGLTLVLVGRPTDGLVSTGVITMNLLVSVIQEVRAKRTLDHIALLNRPRARVMRGGEEREVAPEELVLGDVLAVGAGDQIVVDGQVIGPGRMAVDESQLTGESELIPKKSGDRVYSGSYCVTGSAHYVAERVGTHSLAGQITAGARTFRRVLTPLQRGIYLVIRLALLIVVYIEFLLLVRAFLQGTDLASNVENSTVVAGLIPNGLFLSISVAYALAAVRIVRQGVLVQQSNAIESLSNVDTLCLDKTGTLTANRLQVEGVHPTCAGVSEAELGRILGGIVASASSRNKSSEAIAAAYPGRPHRLVAEVPFSSARKWSAVALDDPDPDGEEPRLHGVYVLGAAEMLHPALITGPGVTAWDAIDTQTRALTRQGRRVLLLARAPSAPLEDKGDESSPPPSSIPLGLVSLSDELRPEAREALAAFRRAGVRPKIISGDDPDTVAALARQAGLDMDLAPVSGPRLEQMDDAAFAATAGSSLVFGRITPQQKERLVRALRAGGAYVAMIGDGVNDVLSLKAADVGVAMQSGSQATRGVADLVLLNDSFASLVPAVAEGQRIVNGMLHILQLFLTRIATLGLVILSSLVVGEFPIGLRQASLVTLLSVGVPTLFLALWARPAPAPRASFLSRVAHFVLSPLLITGAISLLLFYGMLLLNLGPAGKQHGQLSDEGLAPFYAAVLPVAQTGLATFLVLCGLLLVVFSEPPSPWWEGAERVSGDRRPTLLAAGLAVAFVFVTLTPLASLFELSMLGPFDIGLVAVAVLLWLLLVRWSWRRRWLDRFLGVN
jgi:cation-transporting P-type ATPase E